MFKSKIYSLATLAILTLSGCGGGGVSGGGSSGGSSETTPPTFSSSATQNANENQTVAFTASATDASAPVTYSLASAVNDNDDFNINSSSGAITFKTAPNFESAKTTYTVQITATDAVGNSANQTVTITINDVEEVDPVFTSSATQNANENQTTAFTVTATDTSNPIVYSLASGVNDNDSFSINSSTGAITFNTAPDFETKNSYTIQVTATDNVNNSASQTVTITINDVEENPPVFTSATTQNANENQLSAFTVTATDATGPIVFSLQAGVTENDDFNINSSSGAITFKTAPDFETKSTYTITITATDNVNNSATQVVTISINNITDETGPVFTSATTQNANENQTTAFTAAATDPATPIVYSLASGVNDNDDFNINSSSGAITFKTAPDFETKNSYTIQVTATDNFNNSTNQTVTITINDIDGPTFTSATTQSANENQTSAFTVAASDSSAPVTFSLAAGVTDNDDFNINSSSGVITFKAAPDFETKNSYTLTITGTDSLSNNSTQVVTLSINDLDAPTFTSATTQNANENQTTAFTVAASDSSAPIVYSLAAGVNDNDDFNINGTSGAITFKTAPDFETKNSYTIQISATDNASNAGTQNVTITINDVEENPPTFTSATTQNANENQTTAFTVSATDPSAPVTYSLASGVTDNDSFNINGTSGAITFKTAPNFEAKNSYTITVTATDNVNNSATQVVTISINDIDETFTFNGKTYQPVTSPITGIDWLDRNLGADQVCTSSTDTSCYGDYYEWGRLTDGHEKTTSSSTSTRASNILSAGTDFIINTGTPNDWVQNSTQDSTTIDDDGTIRQIQWQKADGNSVCPAGYQVPTLAQLQAETTADSIQDTDTGSNGNIEVTNATTAFQNFLKLPVSGYRKGSDAAMDLVGTQGFLWSTTTSGGSSSNLYYNSSTADTSNENLVNAYPIRCVKITVSGNYPTANAGADQTVIVGTNVTLNGSGSSDDGSISTYTWKEGSITLEANNVTFSKNDFTVGTHNLTLIVEDNDGLKSIDTVTIEVLPTSVTSDGKTYGLIVSPHTNKIWLDRNVGASQVCTSSTDASCYGGYYQWGRLTDGHEISTSATNTTTMAYDDDTNNIFIDVSDWANNDANGALRTARWNRTNGNEKGVDGATFTDICPKDFRVPTQSEVAAETTSQGVTNTATAFTNFLKLPAAGYRDSSTVNDLLSPGVILYLWTNTATTNEARTLRAAAGTADGNFQLFRGFGMSVRCIRD